MQQIPRVLLLQPEPKILHQFVEIFGGWLRADLFDLPPHDLALTDAEVVGFAVTATGECLEQFSCNAGAQVSSPVSCFLASASSLSQQHARYAVGCCAGAAE